MISTNIIRRLIVTALGGVTAATVAAGAVAMSTAAATAAPLSTVALNPQPLPPGIHQPVQYELTSAPTQVDQRPDPYKGYKCYKCPNQVASLPPAS
jgi:hypothetical protein